ncbi:hypothetical protein DIZ27_32440 [Streptomyces sp. NWU339]|nr:hypothetical protein DIZ27_32440 [Streptomyces sp. NWU339]
MPSPVRAVLSAGQVCFRQGVSGSGTHSVKDLAGSRRQEARVT